jgi:hypothetical protein
MQCPLNNAFISLFPLDPGFVGLLLGRGAAGMESLKRAGPLGVLRGVTQGVKGR